MAEIIVLLFPLWILISLQLIAGFIAKHSGRNFWFWFFISFIIPIISIIILLNLEDKKPHKGYKLAEHVKRS